MLKLKQYSVIKDIETEPIINYFNKDFRNFLLVPFREYEEYETSHRLYDDYGFSINFINDIYNRVIDEEYRKQITLSN